MQVSTLPSAPLFSGARHFAPRDDEVTKLQQHNPTAATARYDMLPQGADTNMMDVYPSTETASAHESMSPSKAPCKQVSFELLLPQSPQHRARLPMRVNIFPHDTTDSIITTVKNFYGLYERRGVIFEDRLGNILIARYENFDHGMVVYVRVSAEDLDADEYSPDPHQVTLSPRRPRLHLEEAFQMLPPTLGHQAGTRAGSRGGRHSQSPHPGRGRRSASVNTNARRGRPAAKSRGNSSHGSFADANGDGYSDSDGEGSVSSSRRSRKEPLASADISVDNIVEGGRRKRAKFDSSELPLFVPPQVPMTASLSSVSPQRRISGNTAGSPYSLSNQQTFSYQHPLPSPQSYGQGDSSYLQGFVTPYSASTGPVQGYKSRTRGSGQYAHYRYSGSGALPTPETTLGSISVISDEDVARQLMRLGDASNFSSHGRTSTSTLDDGLSGNAEAASSSEESDDGSEVESELPPLPYNIGRLADAPRTYDTGDSSGEDYEDNRDGSFQSDSDEVMPDGHNDQRAQLGVTKARSSVSTKSNKPSKPRTLSKSKTKVNGASKPPMSPTSLPSQSRKASSASLNFQHQLGVDEEDLSSKPRCQRCRKSKKGCDRQRPCQRCKDAGICADGCVSEDEGNGRKGRYGRHMGVSVKKVSSAMAPPPMHDFAMAFEQSHPSSLTASIMDKSKKRKR
ncbi:hypothetical protein P153DRAFT_296411 [Dothidotthia symphoricarpi CBS 119687]|uniref:Zn(2)-C6 fungal-type domain-containing protein n=1 Tax=Dothidotthia symphoricarpi CBS 119687 TaxID=1392245 RepID=A0A6A6A6E5_9PLEO|nr:uncharacterized protein P153DRAFT_296411 [Dothidotthia symphoricarpi CBS 119687]KAF2126755.1 hypothetical protein P153DRAFT_296411 [Dothidotthia symphoricarpi CBS 119687]